MRDRQTIVPPEPSEAQTLSLAAVGALVGDPVRAAILVHLTDGSRRPASELAYLAGASPQAASAHLARLVEGGLLVSEKLGRHRFFSLPSGEIAEMLEGLSNWADPQPKRRRHGRPQMSAQLRLRGIRATTRIYDIADTFHQVK